MATSDFPQVTNRYPTKDSGEITAIKPVIYFDWTQDIDATQFSVAENLVKFISLAPKNNISEAVTLEFVSYDTTKRRVSVQPSSNLSPSTTYVIILNNKVTDVFGRKSKDSLRWEFTTSATPLSKVTLLSPSDNVVLPVFPTLQWYSVPTTGTVTYLLQLDNTFVFNTPLYQNSLVVAGHTSTASALSLTPAGSFDQNVTYYWRVIAQTATTSGEFSLVYSFYYGEVRIAHPSSNQTWDDGLSFDIKAAKFNTLSNQGAWPALTVVFNKQLSSTPSFLVTAKSLLPRNDIPSSYNETSVGGSWVGSGLTWTFVPDSAIASNTRYEILIPENTEDVSANLLGEDKVLWFTGNYNPYYVHIRSIRSRFMSAEQNIPDDLINFKIFQASLDAKARFYGNTIVGNSFSGYDALKETYVRDTPNLNSYGVLKWTEATAYYSVLKSILAESLRNVGRSRKLGDYQEVLDDGFVKGIKAAMDDAKDEVYQWAQYIDGGDVPLVIQKGRDWNDQYWDNWPSTFILGRRDNYFY